MAILMGHSVSATLVVAAAQSSTTLWYVTRATALAAYVTLSASVILGMLRTIARRASERVSWRVDELHQFIATLAGVFVLGHLLALKFDSYLPFSLANLLLPINEPYRPTAVVVGVFALYTLVPILLTSWLRRRMRYGVWRAVHYISFVCFVLVTIHGWLAGSDSGEPWMRAIYAGASAMVVFLLLARLFVGSPAPTPQSQSQLLD
ncbi:MAG: hypothetical protein OJF49_003556 [Ktedonobacterales bacterium]|jgi:predicted ferric reductase|nr:MAG: hypothetical protein OJF49_003556 [Ktedonobacterales bacterium]